jgi:hypothetical protein
MCGTANVYAQLVSSLVDSPSTQEYDIIFFSYDWRRSNSEIAAIMEEYIIKNDYTDVVFVGHSMGGLVCSFYLLKEANRLRTDKLITLGTPFLGSAKALSALVNGKFFDGIAGIISAPLANPLIQRLVVYCPSVYELLPLPEFFNHTHQGYLARFGQRYKFFKKEETSIDSYEETCDTIISLGLAPNVDEFLSKAQAFHQSLFSAEGQLLAFTGPTKIYNIVGYNLETPAKLKLKYHHGKFKKIDETTFDNGDGTVTLTSATIAGDIPDANSYYVQGVDHMGLISDTHILELILNIVQNESEVFNPERIHTFLSTLGFVPDSCFIPLCSSFG